MPLGTNKMLMEDGSSNFLMEDGSGSVILLYDMDKDKTGLKVKLSKRRQIKVEDGRLRIR